MTAALEFVFRGNQYFTAPDSAVGAVPRAVKGQSDDRPFQLVLGHAADDVGVMVLNLNFIDSLLLPGEAGTQVVRMHIKCNDFRIDAKDAF